jgi:hypothetical protein
MPNRIRKLVLPTLFDVAMLDHSPGVGISDTRVDRLYLPEIELQEFIDCPQCQV